MINQNRVDLLVAEITDNLAALFADYCQRIASPDPVATWRACRNNRGGRGWLSVQIKTSFKV